MLRTSTAFVALLAAMILGSSSMMAQPAISFVSQPTSGYACFGNLYRMTCIANTPATSRTVYQWFRDGNMLNGRTGNFLDLTVSDYGGGGVYSCMVTATDTVTFTGTSSLMSQGASVMVVRESQITSHPSSMAVAMGSTANLMVSVEVVGAPQNYQPTYQWMKRTWNASTLSYNDVAVDDNGRIYGSKSSILTITNIGAADTAGMYVCMVTGFCKGAVTTRAARLFSPTMSASNMTPKLCVGGTMSLSCATSVPTLPEGNASFQWFKGNKALANGGGVTGATSNVLAVSNATTAVAGDYHCVVSYGTRELTFQTNPVTVAVGSEPTIVRNPETTTACEGQVVSLSSVVTGEGLSFQWMRGSEPIKGETGSTMSKLATLEDAGYYTIVVSNECGVKTSRIAEIKVEPLPGIEAQPKDIAFNEGAPISFTVLAKGRNIYNYQWYLNGEAIDGATQATYTVASAKRSDDGQYYCEVSNLCGSVKSRVASASSVMGVTDDVVAGGYVLSTAKPNPTVDASVIGYTVPAAQMVRVVLSDVTGREVAMLVNEMVNAGTHAVSFSAGSLNIGPGVYNVTLNAGSFVATQQVVVVK